MDWNFMINTRELLELKEQNIFDSIYNAYRKHVLPISTYSSVNIQIPKVVGTSFFVQVNKKNYLITAAHVLDKRPGYINKFYLSFLEGQIPLDPVTFIIDYALDIAVCPTESNSKLEYLINDLGYSVQSLDYPDNLKLIYEYYFIYGYPDDRKEIWSRPIAFHTYKIDNSDLYSKYKLKVENHIIVKYSEYGAQNFYGGLDRIPDPYGTAGGMLFKALVLGPEKPNIFIFEGMLTEWKSKQYVISLKKQMILDFIKYNFF